LDHYVSKPLVWRLSLGKRLSEEKAEDDEFGNLDASLRIVL